MKFNSKYGFDLGSITNIDINGDITENDKVLIVTKDELSNTYFLEPRDIGLTYQNNRTHITFKINDYNFNKSFVFLNQTVKTDLDKTICTIELDLTTKQKGMISLSGELFAKEQILTEFYHNHIFTTGTNDYYDESNNTRHNFQKVVWLYNQTSGIRAVKKKQQFANIVTDNGNFTLEPLSSTVGNDPTNNNIPTANLPYINYTYISGILKINIICNPILTNSKQILWFGNLDLIVSAV